MGRFNSGGTGFFVGPSTVLTAAHVLWNFAAGTENTYWPFAPGRRTIASPNFPYGAWARYSAVIPAGFYNTTWQMQLDYGVVDLIPPSGVSSPGWFGTHVGCWRSALTSGYPSTWYSGLQQMVSPSGGCYSEDPWWRMWIDLDITPGNSGGPVYHFDSSGPYAFGIVIGHTPNTAKKMTSDVQQFIGDWSQAW